MGRHRWVVPLDDMLTFQKLAWSFNFVFILALFSTKTCVLLFYSRVFPRRNSSAKFNWAIRLTHGANVLWYIGATVATFFYCKPLEHNWDPLIDEGDCHNMGKSLIGIAICSVFKDLAILLLPLPKIWGLGMSRMRKSGLTVVFILGYL